MTRTASLLVLAIAACDSDFDPPTELRSVRVMAVQKHAVGAASDAAWSTSEGASLKMTMLAFDGRDDKDADVQQLWFAGCSNPLGDAYYACFPELAVMGLLLDRCQDVLGPLPWTLDLESDSEQALRIAECAPELAVLAGTTGKAPPPRELAAALSGSLRVGVGSSFVFDVPSRIVLEREGTDDYGLSYVFFSACAGRVGLVEEYRSAFDTGQFPSDGLVFPLGCYDDAGELRDVVHFVSGYTSVYSYADHASNDHTNPPIAGAVIRGEELAPSAACHDQPCVPEPKVCVGLGCVAEADCDGDSGCPLENPTLSADGGGELSCGDFAACVPACTREHSEDCPEYAWKPLLDESEVLGGPGARDEQMWIRYYVSAGTLSRDPVRLYDANAGWNADYGTKFSAPKDPGPFYVWAAVHDSRGGVNWVRASVLAE